MRKTSGRSALALLSILALALAACSRSGADDTLPEDTAPPADVLPTEDPFTVSLTQSFVETEQAAGFAGGDESIAETESAPVTGGEGELQPEEPVVESTPIPEISVPEPTPIPVVPVVPGLPTVYVVQPGDWIWQIARNFGVDPRAIIEANPGINPDLVQPGQELNIPAPTADNTGGGAGDVPAGDTTYTVSAGENLFRISLGFGLNYIDVAAANAIVSPYLVYPGQVLTIP